MASSAAHASSTARIGRICEFVVDARTVRRQLLAEIARVVAFDAYAWLLTDPQTWVGSSPLADVPCLPELPLLIELKYLTEVNRWTSLEHPVARLADCTSGDLSRSLLWRTLLSRYGVVDVASAVFTDQFGCWGFLDLWRSDEAGPFTATEVAYLAGIVAPITTALRRTQAHTFLTPPAHERYPRGPVVLLLSRHLRVLAQTPDTQDYLRVLIPPDSDRSPVPASAYNVAAQLLANEAGIDRNSPSARVYLADGLWLTLRAARIGDAATPQERDIAVTIQMCTPTERAELFARSYGLSAREAELLTHLATGSDTHDLARQMHLSQHTIQDHLKSIFAKTAVHNRRTLLSRALGT